MDTIIESKIKGAGSGKGGASGPVETPDNLHSIQKARILDLVSEGEIVGLGTVDPLKKVFINGTPIQNADDTFNFLGVQLFERVGTQTQTHITGIPGVEATVSVGVEVKKATPHTITINDSLIDDARVTLKIPGLLFTDQDTGDILGTKVRIKIFVEVDGGGFVEDIDDTISGKSSGGFARDYLIKLPAGGTRQIRMERITDDSNSALLLNRTIFESYTTVQNEKFNYPNSAIYGIEMDSSSFQTIPVRGYKVKGLLVKIPDNYDPLTRIYDPPVWGGVFVTDWTDNPAWVFYDIATNTRYGLGEFITPALINKFDLFAIAQYCDTLVDDGFGGQEPRFTCNLQIQNGQEAYKLLLQLASVFRGMPYWSGGQLTAVQDSPGTPIALFNEANVEGGEFNYSGSAISARHTVALVTWNNPDNLYKPEVEYVENPEGIERYGVREKEMIAIGATSRGQANRVGLWALYSEVNETEIVKFVTGQEATILFPGALIEIQDPSRTQKDFGGRVLSGEVGLTLIDEGFDPDPGWNVLGDSNVIDGEVVSVIVGGGQDAQSQPFAVQTELWAECDFSIDSGFIISGGERCSIFGLDDGAIGALALRIGDDGSGGLEWRTFYAEDVGQVGNSVFVPPIVLGKTYKIKMHWRAATTSSSNDGIVEIELDGIKILDTQTADNNAVVPDQVTVGNAQAGATCNGTIRNDNVKVFAHKIDEFFNPISNDWSQAGNSVSDNGVLTSICVSGSDDFQQLLFPIETDIWGYTEFSIEAINIIDNGHHITVFDLGNRDIGVGVRLLSGKLSITQFKKDDIGPLLIDTPLELELGRTYTAKLHYKKSSGVDTNDGVREIWVDGVKYMDDHNVDDDTTIVDHVNVGCFGTSSTVSATVKSYRAKIALTGEGIEVDSIPLDVPVTLEIGKTYSLSVLNPDGTVENQLVSNTVPGTYQTITVSTAFAAPPLAESVWILESDIEVPEQFRIMSVTESEALNREVVAIAHDPSKFSIIESGVDLEDVPIDITLGTIPVPTNLNLDEFLTTANGEIISVLKAHWDEINKAVLYHVRYRREDGNWLSITVSTNYVDIPNLARGIYTVQVTAQDAKGLISLPATDTIQIQGIDKLELAPRVSGLELFEQGNDTNFIGREAKFTWRKAANIASFNLGSEPDGADSGSLDAFFKDFEIRMFDTNDIDTRVLLRTEHVTDNFYTYTFEKNVEDAKFRVAPNTSIPHRSFVIEVYQRNINNALSAFPAKLVVTNPPPQLPTEIFHTKSVYQHFIRFTAPLDHDWVGMIVWRSTAAGFTPSQANRILKTRDTFLVMEGVPGTTYYYRFAPYDAFDETGLVISGEHIVILNQIVQLDIDPVVTFEIPDLSVTNAKIAELTLQASKLAPNSVVSSKIINGAITSAKILADAVTETKILNDSITTAKLQANSVTANEIQANTITAAQIAALAITAAEIAANTITAAQILANSITSSEILANTITALQIAANTLTAAEILANTLTANEIAANAITTSELAANAVTASKILANTITANEIQANTITGAEIVANTITGAHIFAATITADKYFELRNSLLVTAGDSLDISHPFIIPFPILTEMIIIRSIKLSFQIQPYRAYSTGASAGGQQTTSAGGATVPTTTLAGAQTSSFTNVDHTHGIPVAFTPVFDPGGIRYDVFNAPGQIRGFGQFTTGFLIATSLAGGGSHTHTVANHNHQVTIGNHNHTIQNHTHPIIHGIFEENTSPSIDAFVDNGSGFGLSIGTWTANQFEVNITSHFSGSGFKKLKFTSTLRARIFAVIELKLDISA